jgi:hypothetical protein
MVLLATLAVLGLMLTAYLSRAGERPKDLVCAANIKYLLQAFHSHIVVYTNYPAAARSDAVLTNDWIHWQPIRKINESALAVFHTNLNQKALVCPLDQGNRYRQYQFSYTMNAHLEKLNSERILNHKELFLIYEEEHPNDGACAPGNPDDPLAQRHAHKSQAGLVDGTVRLVSPSEATRNIRIHPVLKEER